MRMRQTLDELVEVHKTETDVEKRRQIAKAAMSLEAEIDQYPLAPDGAYLRWLDTLGDLRGR